ncbi:MAG TPA: ABC transporter ATP-binding protein [Sumerlaeia bacterium]|nr:ABC transporter ATP-binding protein [Sumerlaeia bacterium]
MSEVLIELRGLNKEFHLRKTTVRALKDITLDVYLGEYLSIMGPSGSGKSTLFNMIGALDRPTSGSIRIAALDLTRLSRRQLAYFRGNHIGYVFQTYNLLPAYDALANVSMPLLFAGAPYDRALERAKEVLIRVGLGDRLTHRPEELSGGQQQRVAIARALANDPTIILADEPTGNLDQKTGEEIIRLLKSLSREMHATVITATHDHKMLDASDRILWLSDGAIEKLQHRSELDIRVGTVG